MRFALYVALCVLSLSSAAALRAQPVMQPYYPGFAGLPPHEVLALVRSAGFDPVSRPVRQGPVYVLRALSPADQEVRVVVDARMGRILKVAAVAPTDPGDFAPPAPIPPGRALPDSNTPTPGTASVPPKPGAAAGAATNPAAGISDPRPGLSDPAPKPAVRASAKPAPAPLPRARPKEVTVAEPQQSSGPAANIGANADPGTTANTAPNVSAGTAANTGSSGRVGASASASAQNTPALSTDVDE